ncbi:MAG: AraC family transcriptional regulator CmrA [Hyphomicrobiales bacterium]|nr:MAG: AraC family transcriptional regulator CmrA [Hyphomicrobiales bacterium]
MSSLDDLRDLIARHGEEGRFDTAIPRVALARVEGRTMPKPMVYEPFFCIVAQGAKEVMLGERIVRYARGNYLIVSLDLPVSSAICEASPQHPLLSTSLSLNPGMLADILLTLPENAVEPSSPSGLEVSTVTEDLLDAMVRMLCLLDQPKDIPMLAPLIEREILYRLMQGDQGAMLRQIALADSRLSQIARAIGWIRKNFSEPMRVEALAGIAGMSASSFHRHFKAATAMSPLQFQKQIRLQEARKLLLAQKAEASRVGFAVGYESPSQFSREYSRLFGIPPGRDAAQLRALGTDDPAALAELLHAEA